MYSIYFMGFFFGNQNTLAMRKTLQVTYKQVVTWIRWRDKQDSTTVITAVNTSILFKFTVLGFLAEKDLSRPKVTCTKVQATLN